MLKTLKKSISVEIQVSAFHLNGALYPGYWGNTETTSFYKRTSTSQVVKITYSLNGIRWQPVDILNYADVPVNPYGYYEYLWTSVPSPLRCRNVLQVKVTFIDDAGSSGGRNSTCCDVIRDGERTFEGKWIGQYRTSSGLKIPVSGTINDANYFTFRGNHPKGPITFPFLLMSGTIKRG